jgi:hypothetical protein
MGDITLRVGSPEREAVRRLQRLLIEAGELPAGADDGRFGAKTQAAVWLFQGKRGLKADGIVGPLTWAALTGGKVSVVEAAGLPDRPDGWPRQTVRQLTDGERAEMLGTPRWAPRPADYPGQEVVFLDDYEERQIVFIETPILSRVGIRRLRFHRMAAGAFQRFLGRMPEAMGQLILSCDGAYYPRYQRKSCTRLSNHAMGTALDLNSEWNEMGRPPAARGSKGSVVELVEWAQECCLCWGGFWSGGSRDGMHFEMGARM